MKVSELTAEHIGAHVEVNDPGHVKVAGMLTRVTHEAVLVDERTISDRHPQPVVAEVKAWLMIGDVYVEIADGDLATVAVTA